MTKKTSKRTNLRLSDLAVIRKGVDYNAYKRAIDGGKLDYTLKQLLMRGKNSLSRHRNTAIQLEAINVLMNQQEEAAAKLVGIKEELEIYEENVDKARALYEAKKDELKEAEDLLKESEATYRSAHADYCNEMCINSTMIKAVEAERQRLKQMDQYLLIHPSAKLTALNKRCGCSLVCTAYDNENCCYIADIVEDTSDSKRFTLMEEEVPEGIRNMFATEKSYKSAVEYVKLALMYEVEDKNPQLLYDNVGIKKLLKLQGLEV